MKTFAEFLEGNEDKNIRATAEFVSFENKNGSSRMCVF
jgi:hypothetical protein